MRRRVSSTRSARALRAWPSVIACSACPKRGAQAELAVLSYYAPIPPSLDFPEAAALPAAVETATRALDQIGVASGSTLLVNGASGIVGSAAVQLAGARGARVIGTASPANHDYLCSLGAEPVPTARARVGGFARSRPAASTSRSTSPGVGSCQSSSSSPAVPARRHARRLRRRPGVRGEVQQRRRRPRGSGARRDRRADRVRVLLAPGRADLPLAKVAQAHRVGERGHARGKLVLLAG